MSTPTSSLSINNWLFFKLGGLYSPGTIPRGGIKGFRRQTGWDKKAGKGTKGATLTLKDQPPCEGSIIMQLIGPGGYYANGLASQDFANWDEFVVGVLSIPAQQQQAQGLSLFYPQFLSIDLTTVVVADYTGPEHMGRGLYHAEVKLIEWQPPPDVSIVSTVQATKTDQELGLSFSAVPPPEDPRLTQRKQAFAAASQASSP